jgi:hypothetical protein
MKKWLFIILVAILVMITVVVIFLPTGREYIFKTGQAVVEVVSIRTGGERSLAGMIPERAGIFIRIQGIDEAWDELTGSEFIQRLKDSKLWKDAKVDEDIRKFQKEFSARNGFEINRSRLMELVGDDIALAVLPAGEESQEALLIISRVGLKARLVEILVRWGDGLLTGEKGILTEEKYRGEKVCRISPTGSFPFFGAYTFIENYLVVSLSRSPSRSAIEDAIDLSRDGTGRGALKDLSDFIASRREVSFPSESSLEWYLKPEVFNRGPAAGDIYSGQLPAIEWGREIVKDLSGVKTVAGRLGYNRGIRFSLALELEEDIVDSQGDSDGHLQDYIPTASMIFAESSIDPAIVWEKFIGTITDLARQGYGEPLLGLRSWEMEAGVNVTDGILSVLGGRMALCIEGITGDEFLPISPAAVIIKITDREKMERIMGRISVWAAGAYNWRLVREKFGDTVIMSAGEDTGGELNILRMLFPRPAYAILGSELIISSSTELLKGIIESTTGEKPGLETDPDFREVAGVIGPPGDNFIYLNGKEVIRSLLNLGEWYLPIQRLSREEPWLPEDLFREKIVPILNLCDIFKSAGISINSEKRLVKGDCFLYIE